MVGEVEKGRGCRPFLSLEQHRDKGAKQHKSRGNLGAICASVLADSVADSPVTHLIMILNETQKAMLRQISHWTPMHPFTVSGKNPIVDERLLKRLGKLTERA